MSAVNTMTLQRFAQIVDAYGAEPRAWPEDEREAALGFCAGDSEAQRLREEAKDLDVMLAECGPIAPSRALEDRIMAGFKASRRSSPRRWIGASALAASLVLGVTAAWVVLRPASGVDLSDPSAWEVLGDDLEFAARQDQ
jgi:hypothetical protein